MQIEAEIARTQKTADFSREAMFAESKKLQSVANANEVLASNTDELYSHIKDCQNVIQANRYALLHFPSSSDAFSQ